MVELRELTSKDDHLIGSIIGQSFADDPVNKWVFNGVTGMTPYYKSTARKLYLKQGFGHVTMDGTGGAMWLPPMVSKEIPLWNSIDIAASMLWHGGVTSVKNGIDIDAMLLKHKPKEPHYYLFAIGTLPEHHGKGIGSRVMKAALDVVDTAKMPAYLESSKYSNVPFYQRYGFEVTEQVSTSPEAPPLWLMWRPER